MSLVKSPTVWVLVLLGAGFIGTIAVLAVTKRNFRTSLKNLFRRVFRLRIRPGARAPGSSPPPGNELVSRPYSPDRDDMREGPPPYDAIELPAYNCGVVNPSTAHIDGAAVATGEGEVSRPLVL